MLHQQTIAQLRELKLPGMAAALQRQSEQPASSELAFEQRLALLVQQECDHRHERRCTRLLQQARLKYPLAAIEDFDTRPGRGIERSRYTSLALSDWATAGHTVILTGATGCGKTWMACALAQYACRQGHSTRYLRVPRLAEELRTLRAAGSYTKWLAQLAKTQVVVLDDWGLVGLDALTREALMEILDDRAGTRATLVTSQLPVEHWHAWIGDPAMADAMLDRMLQQAHRIVLKGESLRTPERPGGGLPAT
ncbi:IS21-like element helper ATPase IstB [Eoetvoesiella caeni]|uniref:DNA replication protein DnaC n=1 Tax=Eoetvoesiella caeni TaxID=645616 RepID=A0A366H2F1_9BURK|nr:IS21-like element helper ATPase IstB [Eoetvoesiella caeni]MCI2811236.1 IS21-like element helper ATPase IstB [Eoetvoesiella caeni]NYT57114.1 ATP-binding protein [Eoetvoesiella caeni]RBP34102.1 DNA replication protein DnaC [Eoetvoesiella caeni]